jgi:hypothetical protein
VRKSIALLIISAVLVSCTSKAGPFVTNISSDGAGGIVVEKCMVSLQRQISTMENSDCTNSNIKLSAK